MYHIRNTVDDEYNKGGRSARGDKATPVNFTAVTPCKFPSNERAENRNTPFIDSNMVCPKVYMQEKESALLKSKVQENIDPFEHKLKKQLTDSTKPLTVSEEPSHYNEFATKLGYLVGKITKLAMSSGDISIRNSERTEFQNVLGNKTLNTITSTMLSQTKHSDVKNSTNEMADKRRFNESFLINKEYSNVSHFGKHYVHKIVDPVPIRNDKEEVQKLDPQYLTYRMVNKCDSLIENMIPPLLDDNIKYIKVNSKDSEKWRYISSLKKDLESPLYEKQTSTNGSIRHHEKDSCKLGSPLSLEAISEDFELNSYINEINTMNEAAQEKFRILISGHLTAKEIPVFIIHKNYVSSSIFIKDSPDFRTHKKKGNVDISLTGKFFHDNILIENDKGFPSALDFKSHTLFIDDKSTVTQERFKHIFHLGLNDAILEGEFVENSETLQFIPIFSLEVVKHKPGIKINSDESMTILNEIDEKNIINLRDETKGSKPDEQENTGMLHSQDTKHVYYSTDTQRNVFVDASKNMKQKKVKKSPKENKGTKLKGISLFKLFFKNKENNSNKFQHAMSSQNTSSTKKTTESEKEEVMLSKNKINKKDNCDRKNQETEKDHKLNKNVNLEVCEVNNNSSDSCSSPKRSHTREETHDFKDKITEKKSVKKKQIKRSKIVENPGLPQIQGFFFQT